MSEVGPWGLPPAPPAPAPPPRKRRAGSIVVPIVAVVLGVAVNAGAWALVIPHDGKASSSPNTYVSPIEREASDVSVAIAAEPTTVSVTLSLQASGSGIERLVVTRDGTKRAELPGTATTYEDGSLDPGRRYVYRLDAVDSSGAPLGSATTTVETLPIPTVDSARLSGAWTMHMTFTSSRYPDHEVGDRRTEQWNFSPDCTTGACPGTLIIDTAPHSVIHMSEILGLYQGLATIPYDVCPKTHLTVDTFLDIRLNVVDAELLGSSWQATRVTGTVSLTDAPQSGCPSMGGTLTLRGEFNRV